MEDPENEIYQLLLLLNINYRSLAGHTFAVSHYPGSAVNDPLLRKYYPPFNQVLDIGFTTRT